MISQDTTALLKKCFTRDNITLVLAILGSAGTAISWLSSYLHSRKSLHMQIERICKFKNSVVAYVTILNKSTSPISISCISVKVSGKLYTGYHVPLRSIHIDKSSDGKTFASHDCITMSFPINLGEQSGASGYLMFDIPAALLENLETALTFVISSNRGRPLEKKLSFSQWKRWSSIL